MHLELVVAKLVTMTLGVVIADTASEGYPQRDSEPMPSVTVGTLIVTYSLRRQSDRARVDRRSAAD